MENIFRYKEEKLFNTTLRYLVCIILSTGLTICISIQNGQAQKKPLKKVTLALQWLTQCQFAGYYVALEQGYYKQEGIDITIIPGASDINPIYQVSSGVADFGTKWLADFIAAKDKGEPLISIAQVLQSNGLVLIAKAKSNIKTPHDFIDKKIGIWFFGNETQFFALMNKLNISLDQMHVSAQKWSIKPFLNNEFDVAMAMIYNEYLRVLDSGYDKKEINVIDFSQYGMNFPGQVIFTRKSTMKKQPELCKQMLKASLKGWAWAIDHPEAAVDIVLKHDKTKILKKERQLRQMKAITKLIKYGNRPLGYHSPEQVASVMQNLVQHKVIPRSMELSEVYTNQIWEKARISGTN